jgi:hypothetical protein
MVYKSLLNMNSPWQVPLSLFEDSSRRVAVYFYDSGWIPIAFYPSIEAIKLHRKGLSLGMDIAIFPPGLDPRSLNYETPVLSEQVTTGKT